MIRVFMLSNCLRLILLPAGALLLLAAAPAPHQADLELTKAYERAKELGCEVPDKDLLGENTREGNEAVRTVLKCIRNALSETQTPEERAALHRHAIWLEIQLGNLKQAIRDMEAIFETGTRSEVESVEDSHLLGRLYLGDDQAEKAIAPLRKYVENAEEPSPWGYFALSAAYARSGDCRSALPHARKAIDVSPEPWEAPYRQLLECYRELGQTADQAAILNRLIELFPSDRNSRLERLARLYRRLGKERDAFLAEARRYELQFKFRDEEEIVALARLYAAYGNAHGGARVLAAELESGRLKRTPARENLLENMRFLAAEYEKARAVLIETAGGDAPPADCRIVDYPCSEVERRKTEARLRRMLNEDPAGSPCQARVLLALSLNNRNDLGGALRQLRLARRSMPCRDMASRWSGFLADRNRVEWQNLKRDRHRDTVEEDFRKRGIP